MKRFALIGHPVAGSMSPVLFGAAYQGRYRYDLIDAPFREAWSQFLDSYHGINITAPYKQDAFASVDWLSAAAKACGAVNLAVKADDGSVRGYNTDVDGVVGAVRETGLAVSSALILGAGGAARAAIQGAKLLGCSSVTIANRTLSKALELAASMECSATPLEDIGAMNPDLVIYTIPGTAIPALTPGLLDAAIVLEADYRHPSLASAPCRRYIHGRRWLLWQAVAGYELFTGEKPDLKAMASFL